jgi:hypothetical protein
VLQLQSPICNLAVAPVSNIAHGFVFEIHTLPELLTNNLSKLFVTNETSETAVSVILFARSAVAALPIPPTVESQPTLISITAAAPCVDAVLCPAKIAQKS